MSADSATQGQWLNTMGKHIGVKVPPVGTPPPPPSLDAFQTVTELLAGVRNLEAEVTARCKSAEAAAVAVAEAGGEIRALAASIGAAGAAVAQALATLPPAPAQVTVLPATDPKADGTKAIKETDEAAARFSERVRTLETASTSAEATGQTALGQVRALELARSRADQKYRELSLDATGAEAFRDHVATAAGRVQRLLATLEQKSKAGGAAAKAIDLEAERTAAGEIAAIRTRVQQAAGAAREQQVRTDADMQAILRSAADCTRTLATIGSDRDGLVEARRKAEQDAIEAKNRQAAAKALAEALAGTSGIAVRVGPFEPTIPPIKINRDVGPITVKEITVKVSIDGVRKIAAGGAGTTTGGAGPAGPGGSASAKLGSGVTVKGSGDMKKTELAIEKEIVRKLNDSWSFKEKGAVKGSQKEVGLEFEAALENQTLGSFGVTFTVIGREWKSGDVKIMEAEIAYEVPSGAFGTVLDYEITAKGKIGLAITPNWKALAEEMAKRFGPGAATELALAGGIIANAAVAIGYSLYRVMHADEAAVRGDAANALLKSAIDSYVRIVTGLPPTGGPGAEIGAECARQFLATSGTPMPELVKAADAFGLREKAKAACIKPVREAAIKAYWEEHYVEAMLPGGEGDNFGYGIFVKVLDASLANA